MLVDSGAVSSEDCGLLECIHNILLSCDISIGIDFPLLVVHTHSHGDHVGGDCLFANRRNVVVVGHGVDAVAQFFSLTKPSDTYGTATATATAMIDESSDDCSDESHISLFDLGGRILKVFFIPGHYDDHIALYDIDSCVLLSGDFLYRGRLYVENRAAFRRSTQVLNQFEKNNRISAVLGSHVEMTSTPGVDYPDGTLFQPDEPVFYLDSCSIGILHDVVERAAIDNPDNWGVLRTSDFIVTPCELASAPSPPIRIALLRKVFFKLSPDDCPKERLCTYLREARDRGADVVVLPELPMDEWYPRSKESCEGEVCENLHDARIVAMAEGAKVVGITVVGGALIRGSSLPSHLADGVHGDLELNAVRNVTLIFDKQGEIIATHMKRHLPKEEGFWEGAHFEAAPGIPSVMRGVVPGLLVAVQTCSDIMRPSSHSLSALGAGLIFNPRATEAGSTDKWRRIVSGIAATTSTFIVSVPRPAPEGSLDLGGEAFVISPTGEVLISSNDDICTCDIDLVELGKARVNSYPGYLNVRAEDYATAWNKVSLYQKGFKSNY